MKIFRNALVFCLYYSGHFVSKIFELDIVERLGIDTHVYTVYNYLMTKSCMLDTNHFMWSSPNESRVD